MEKSAKIEGILAQVKQFDRETKIHLVEKLEKLLKKTAINKKQKAVKLSDLNNKGSEIWQNVNIDRYIEQERQWD